MIPFEDVDTAAIRLWLDTVALGGCPAVRVICGTEPEWLAARVNGIGASEVSAIVGASSWTSPYALWWRKKLDWRPGRTEYQRWGHLVEDPIAELFAEVVADDLYVVKPVGAPYSLWAHPVQGWMLCTPDRLAVDRGGHIYPVEIKSDEGGKGWGASGTDEVPDAHKTQLMWQAHIFGAPGGYLARRRGSGKGRLAWYYVPYDEEWLAPRVEKAAAFLASIAADEPPPPDGSKATTETLQLVNPAIDAGDFALVGRDLYEEWHAAREAKRQAVAAEAAVSNRLRHDMGRAEFATYLTSDGLQVIFAKRRIGKRSGYEVGPATTDELREISGQHDEGPAVSGPTQAGGGNQPPAEGVVDECGGSPGADGEAAPPVAEEGHGDGDPEGAGVGGGETGGDDGVHPEGTENVTAGVDRDACICGHEGLDRMFHLFPCPIRDMGTVLDLAEEQEVERAQVIASLPSWAELSALIDRALTADPSEQVTRERPVPRDEEK